MDLFEIIAGLISGVFEFDAERKGKSLKYRVLLTATLTMLTILVVIGGLLLFGHLYN